MLLHATTTILSHRDFDGNNLGAMGHSANDVTIEFMQRCVQDVNA